LSRPEALLPLRRTEQGWNILRVHYSVIPDYDFESACEGLSEEGIRQELEIDWSASSNKRVFPEFGPIHIAARSLKFDPRRPLVMGWDFAKLPAWVTTQINEHGQWCLFPPLVGDEDSVIGIYDFGRLVAAELWERYAQPYGLTSIEQLKLRHFGDPAGNAKPPKTAAHATNARLELRSAYQVLRKGVQVVTGFDERDQPIVQEKPGWGWRVEPGAVGITERLEAVRARLTMSLRAGVPALIVDPDATELLEGFGGAYCYRQRPDGRFELDPDKNWHSHPMDCVQYVATRLFATAPVRDEDDDEPQRDGFRSQASSRRGRR